MEGLTNLFRARYFVEELLDDGTCEHLLTLHILHYRYFCISQLVLVYNHDSLKKTREINMN